MAAGSDGRQDLIRLGRRQDELHPRRRFLERLEERVEGVLRELVDFVDNEDLERAVARGVLAFVTDALGVFDAAIGSGVDLDDVEAVTLLDCQADRVVEGEIRLGAACAVQGLGQDAGGGRLAGAAGADEKVGVCHALRLERIAEGPDDMLLPDEFVETAGTPAARDDLEAGFRHWQLGKDGLKRVSTGQMDRSPIGLPIEKQSRSGLPYTTQVHAKTLAKKRPTPLIKRGKPKPQTLRQTAHARTW